MLYSSVDHTYGCAPLSSILKKLKYETVFKCSRHGLELQADGAIAEQLWTVQSRSNFDDDGARPVPYLQVVFLWYFPIVLSNCRRRRRLSTPVKRAQSQNQNQREEEL